MQRFCHAGLLLLPLLLLAGCSHGPSQNDRLNTWLLSQQDQLPPPQYHVEPPDELVISAPKIKELDTLHYIVRPDGKISMSIVGDIYVNGKTPDEIAQLIRHAAARFYD